MRRLTSQCADRDDDRGPFSICWESIFESGRPHTICSGMKHENGKIVADSGEGYHNKADLISSAPLSRKLTWLTPHRRREPYTATPALDKRAPIPARQVVATRRPRRAYCRLACGHVANYCAMSTADTIDHDPICPSVWLAATPENRDLVSVLS